MMSAPDQAPTPLALAIDYCRRGWSPIPIPYRRKGPVVESWPQLRITPQTAGQYFGAEPQNIGILLGSPSGHLTDIDLDTPEAQRLAPQFLPPTPSTFGRPNARQTHWLYVVPGARTEGFDLKESHGAIRETTIVELRADNVQTVFPGSTHQDTGDPITWDEDGEPSPVIATQLRDAVARLATAAALVRAGWPETEATLAAHGQADLLADALALDPIGAEIGKWLGFAPAPEERTCRPVHRGTRPGDDFNRQAMWHEVLEPHGWVPTTSRSGKLCWRRPGKEHGISATTNYANSDLLYVFSTSTQFDARRGYSKFSAHTLLNYGSLSQDAFTSAVRDLSARGYGAAPPIEAVDLSQIMSRPNDSAKPTFPPHLLQPQGLIQEIADWINQIAVLPQPILSLGAAIALTSLIIGRRVRTSTGLRPNLYILGIVESGGGKEHARQAIKRVLNLAGAAGMEIEDFASDAAVYSSLRVTPSAIYLSDEFGRTLQAMSRPHAPSHLSAQVSLLMRLYGASSGTLRGKAYADRDKQVVIEQPHLVAYLTTAPGPFRSAITSEYVEDGLLSRLLPFVSEDPDPEFRFGVDADREPPQSIIDAVQGWLNRPVAPGQNGNLADLIPDPLIVEETAGATSVMRDLSSTMRGRRIEMRKSHRGHASLFTRVQAAAAKLALVRACGRCETVPQIQRSDAEWGAELATHLVEQLALDVERHSADSPAEKNVKKMLRLVVEAGADGIARSTLTRRTQRLTPRERMEALATLEDSAQIVACKVGEGRSERTVYRALD